MRISYNKLIVIILFVFNVQITSSQEYKNLRTYKKLTGQKKIQNGCWLKKDRNRNTETWKLANKYNLLVKDGNLKYKTIKQIRDFYLWYDSERKKLGHEINTFGIVAIVAGQLSYLDSCFIRTFIVRNKEVVWFGNEGSKRVFSYIFPLLKDVYFSKNVIKDQNAKDWETKIGKIEQCKIVEPLYNKLSPKAIRKLERMAKGKGIFGLVINKQLKFNGDIRNCKSRYEHAFTTLYQYYLNNY